MKITGGILIQGGIRLFSLEGVLPNPYTENYTFLSGTPYNQCGPVEIHPNVVLTFENTTEYIVKDC